MSEPINPPQPFEVGQLVNAVAFVDCFGRQVVERRALTVRKVTLQDVTRHGMANYWRVLADREEPYNYVEGAASYFEATS